jgi:hypothetical protein
MSGRDKSDPFSYRFVGELAFTRDEGCMLLLGRGGSRGVKSSGKGEAVPSNDAGGGTLATFVVFDPYVIWNGSPVGVGGRGGECGPPS